MARGHERVGVNFNPSGNHLVEHFKSAVADLIDQLEPFRVMAQEGDSEGRQQEIARCAAIAQTKLEEACMWAVKTITK